MDWERLGYLLTVPFAWTALAALAFADVLAERRGAALPVTTPRPWDRQRLGALAGVALALTVVRAVLATSREVHGVDEFQYAASAALVRNTGGSLLGAHNFGIHQWLFLLGPWDAPFRTVDVFASLAVGLAAFLLGWTLRGRGIAVAIAAAVFYAAGLLRFEGLSSNKEPFVGLALAAWAAVRLGTPGVPSRRRRLAAGACLGLAAAFKEQALAFALLEPLLLVGEAREGLPRRRLVAGALLAGAGWVLGALPLLLPLAWRGELPAFVTFLHAMGSNGGHPPAEIARVLEAPPPPPRQAADLFDWAAGLLPLWASPVALLGLAGLLRLPFRATPARDPGASQQARVEVGAAGLACIGIACASIGQRWFAHYFMLAVPGLSLLAALESRRAILSLGVRARRLPAAALLALALVNGLVEARFLAGQDLAQGNGLSPEPMARLDACARAVAALTPSGSPILVWGWRPELYFAAHRPPATRYVGGLTATRAEVLADLATLPPPAAVVLVGENGLCAEPFELGLHPPLVEWLRSRRFEVVYSSEGYTVLVPPR